MSNEPDRGLRGCCLARCSLLTTNGYFPVTVSQNQVVGRSRPGGLNRAGRVECSFPFARPTRRTGTDAGLSVATTLTVTDLSFAEATTGSAVTPFGSPS